MSPFYFISFAFDRFMSISLCLMPPSARRGTPASDFAAAAAPAPLYGAAERRRHAL